MSGGLRIGRVSLGLMTAPETAEPLVVVLVENTSVDAPLCVTGVWVVQTRWAGLQMRAHALGLRWAWAPGATRALTPQLPTRLAPGEAAVVDLPFDLPGLDWTTVRHAGVEVAGGFLFFASRRSVRAFRRAVAGVASGRRT